MLSILGNTDKKVIKLIKGKTFSKPGNPEKKIMYTSTAEILTKKNRRYLIGLKKFELLNVALKEEISDAVTIGLYHGSPAAHHEFLFSDTPDARFEELAAGCECDVIVTGHSHSPYHKYIEGIHFINPGSLGRMFDGDSSASCATIEISGKGITVGHFRISYDVKVVVAELLKQELPEIYCEMYRQGRKLN